MPVLFRVAGDVDLVCLNVIPSGNSLSGNSTPSPIKLSDIVVLHQDGKEFGSTGARRCNGMIQINKVNTEGNYTKTYLYFTLQNKLGWYDTDGVKAEGDNDVPFAPGEAFLVNNMYKSMPVIIKLPSPVKD